MSVYFPLDKFVLRLFMHSRPSPAFPTHKKIIAGENNSQIALAVLPHNKSFARLVFKLPNTFQKLSFSLITSPFAMSFFLCHLFNSFFSRSISAFVIREWKLKTMFFITCTNLGLNSARLFRSFFLLISTRDQHCSEEKKMTEERIKRSFPCAS